MHQRNKGRKMIAEKECRDTFPGILICMATYNGADYLEEQLESLRRLGNGDRE